MNALYGVLHRLLIAAYLVAPVALALIAAARIWYAGRKQIAHEAGGDAGRRPDPVLAPAAHAVISDAESVPRQEVAQVAVAARRRREEEDDGTLRIAISVISMMFAGAVIGMSLAMIYASYIAGSFRAISAGQLLLCAYAGIGLIALLRGFDAVLQYVLKLGCGWLGLKGRAAAPVALFVRVLVLVVFMLPFSMAATMTFRPKVVPAITPMTEFGVAFERVEFRAEDGTRIAGWWIAANPRSSRRSETVLVVHGLGSGKADVLPMAGAMYGAGYNVLLFDLRAHGESGGHFTSFGVHERKDVEAAAGWVRANKAAEGERLLAVGASMGAAAMLAARDESGRSPFDAMAVLGTYDDLGLLARTMIRTQFWGPIAHIAQWTGLPAASMHAGADLSAFRPAELAQGAWPAALMVGHSQRDEIIPYTAGARLYNAAFEPKRSLWVQELGHVQILSDAPTLAAVLRFFQESKRAPRGVV